MAATTGRREAIADAAVTVIAERGIRGLTHRAVDEAAGLPAGSTSYYFRTRTALLEAVVAYLVRVDLAAFEAAGAGTAGTPAGNGAAGTAGSDPLGPADLDALSGTMAATIDSMLVERRRYALARYACLLEAARIPQLRGLLGAGAPFRAMAADLLRRAGAPDPAARAADLVACLDGLLFDRLAGAGAERSEPAGTGAGRERLRLTIRDVLRGMTGQ